MRLASLLILAALVPWLSPYVGHGEPTCAAAPIELRRLNQIIAAAPPPPEPEELPSGERPATPRESRAMRDLLARFVACSDAGEPLRVLSLYTDRYLGDLYYRQGRFTEDQYASLARADPVDPDERTRLVSLTGIAGLPDGRVVAEATLRYAVIPDPKRLLFTIAEVDGTWRIDDILGELTFALP